MVSTNDFKTGLTLLMDGAIYTVAEFQHVKPGKGGAFVRTKLKRMRDGSVIERTFRVGEKFDEAYIEERKLQFQYRTGESFHFMDLSSYEEIALEIKQVGESAGFVKENMECVGQFFQGQFMSLELPIFVELRIEETEPGIRGDTSKAGTKPAKVETGATIQVPLFVDQGETIKVDTRTGSYVSRA